MSLSLVFVEVSCCSLAFPQLKINRALGIYQCLVIRKFLEHFVNHDGIESLIAALAIYMLIESRLVSKRVTRHDEFPLAVGR